MSSIQDEKGAIQHDEKIDYLKTSIHDLEDEDQYRSAQEKKLELAKEFCSRNLWDDALKVLRPLWQAMTYRDEGWWDITEDIGWTLREVAANVGDGGTIVAVDWELMNRTFTQKPDWPYDINKSLEGINTVTFKPAVVIREEDVHSFLSATFAFEHAEGKVGELYKSQLTITSHAVPSSSPITLTEITMSFEGSLRPVIIRHTPENEDDETRPSGTIFSKVALKESSDASTAAIPSIRGSRSTAFEGQGNLIFPPGKSRVLEFTCPLREPGEARATTATFSVASELFDLDYVVDFNRNITPDIWWSQPHAKKRIARIDPHAISILPKPPKMDIRFIEFQEQYYTNETIALKLEINNGEDEESIANLSVAVSGDNPPVFEMTVTGTEEKSNGGNNSTSLNSTSSLVLGKISSADSISVILEFSAVALPAMYEVTIELSYHLSSDLDTPIYRRSSTRLIVINPFEANYDFSPRVDLTPWPSFFDHSESIDIHDTSNAESNSLIASGLSQRWCLTTRYASFATGTLLVEDVSVDTLSLNGGLTCVATKVANDDKLPLIIEPSSIEECQFNVATRKLSLDDRRSASLDLSLVIKWRRNFDGAVINTTILPIPRLLVASSEPRVLASVSYSTVIPSMIHLDYTIENPSMHFLTFGMVMSPNDSFAFSGVKQSTIQLVPLSRRVIRLKVLPSVRGEWIRPQFIVKDRYFQKILKVAPTDGMKIDKEGILIWVPPDED